MDLATRPLEVPSPDGGKPLSYWRVTVTTPVGARGQDKIIYWLNNPSSIVQNRIRFVPGGSYRCILILMGQLRDALASKNIHVS